MKIYTCLSCLVISLLILVPVGCGPADEAPPPTTSESPTDAPAAADEAAATPNPDQGRLTFEVADGPHAGSYGGALSDDSVVSSSTVGGQTYLTIRLLHEQDDSMVSLAGTVQLDGPPAPGEVDMTGQLVTIGYLPDGVSRDPKYFSVNTAAGSGTLTLDRVDVDAGVLAGSFVAMQGELTLEGDFELDAR